MATLFVLFWEGDSKALSEAIEDPKSKEVREKIEKAFKDFVNSRRECKTSDKKSEDYTILDLVPGSKLAKKAGCTCLNTFSMLDTCPVHMRMVKWLKEESNAKH